MSSTRLGVDKTCAAGSRVVGVVSGLYYLKGNISKVFKNLDDYEMTGGATILHLLHDCLLQAEVYFGFFYLLLWTKNCPLGRN